VSYTVQEPAAYSVVGLTVTTVPNAVVEFQTSVNVGTARIRSYLGAPGQTADAALIAAFPALWTSAHTVSGVAYLICEFDYDESAFPTGIPSVSAVIRGAKCYDPRSTLTVWTENPAIMARHILRHPQFGKRTSLTAAEDSRINAAANACDTATTYTVGGVAQASRALYKAAIVLPFGATAQSALDDLVQAIGGQWAYSAGEFYIRAGTYTAPVVALVDADLATVQRGEGGNSSQAPITITTHRARDQQFNVVTATIWSEVQGYKQTALTPLKGAALITRDGAELVQDVNMPAVGYAPQALHIAGIMMRDARDPLTLDIAFKMTAYRIEVFDVITLTLSRYGWVAKQFMVMSRSWSSTGSVVLRLKETDASITQLDAAFLAQGYALNTSLAPPWIVGAVGTLSINSGTVELIKQIDGSIITRMRIAWAQSADIGVRQGGSIDIQYRRAGTPTAEPWMVVTAAGDDTQVLISGLRDGDTYLVRARARTLLAVGDWEVQVSHQVVGKREAPPPFDTFLVMAQPDGTRQFNFGYITTEAPLDWLGAQIRYTPGNVAAPVWADMSRLQDGQSFYTNSPIEANAPLAGEYTFACRSLDTSGNLSTALIDSIVLSARRTGNVFDEFDEGLLGWPGTRSGFNILGGVLEATDSTTWATAPATWTGWARWNTTPTSPATYTSANVDLGTVVSGQLDALIDADGTPLLEMATSADGSTWSGWGSASAPFTARWVRARLTVTATGPMPVPVVRKMYWNVNAELQREYINDLVIAGLTGSYKIGTGDIRVPLTKVYSTIKRIGVTIQDSSAGTWTYQRIDNVLTYGPRFQFKLSGTLANPSYVDFDIEGL